MKFITSHNKTDNEVRKIKRNERLRPQTLDHDRAVKIPQIQYRSQSPYRAQPQNNIQPQPWNEHRPEIKGESFEHFVLDRFEDKEFAIVEMTHKFAGPGYRYVESDLNPDFTLRHRATDIVFAVEAKYRSNLVENDMLEWCNEEQLVRYNIFSIERSIPVYIIIGLGGSPDFPGELFLIPLEEARYPKLYPSVYIKYSRSFNNFYLVDGKLK